MGHRKLNDATLDQAAKDYAGRWFLPSIYSWKSPDVAIDGRDWVLQNMYRFAYKDEFEHFLAKFKRQLGPDPLKDFIEASGDLFTPRHDDVLAEQLEKRLAVNPAGEPLKGKIGTNVVGQRFTGYFPLVLKLPRGVEHVMMRPIREPIYAGEMDPLELKRFLRDQSGALAMNVSAAVGVILLNALVDHMESQAGAGVIKGYDGAQPADPDVASSGNLLFTAVCTNPAFPTAVDDTDGTISATASAITDDSSADATFTMTNCRASASADGAAETDVVIDGSAGTTSSFDYNFNTVAIVAGATVSISSWVINFDQGTSAT